MTTAHQPAYDAVYAYIRNLDDVVPNDEVSRNAMIWHAVEAALGASPAPAVVPAVSWGLRCFPSLGDRSAVVVLAGPSTEERREVGRLVLDAGEIEDLCARLTGASERETELDWARDAAEKWHEMVKSPSWLRAWLDAHGLSDSAGPAAVLAAVAADYRGYWVTLGGQDAPRGSVQRSPIPEFCHYCGPGYRYGSEGCRHTPPRGSVQPVSYVAEALARVDAIDRRASGTDPNPTEEGR